MKMGIFDLFKKAKDAVNKNLNPEYSKNKDFLEALAASAALVAAADGDISADERTTAIGVMTGHASLSALYSLNDIKDVAEKMFQRTGTVSGRMQLNRELDDLNNKPGAQQMKEDAFYMALDIASADGNVSPQEEAVLKKLATKLGVQYDTTL
jgi:tellurite resistance protein TerB